MHETVCFIFRRVKTWQKTVLCCCNWFQKRFFTKIYQNLIIKYNLLKRFFQLVNFIIELHREDLIHGDFKLDNVMLSKISTFDSVLGNGRESQGIRVIDWGRAINGRSISSPWTGKCYTSGFVIPQMKVGKPWRYQVRGIKFMGLRTPLLKRNSLNNIILFNMGQIFFRLICTLWQCVFIS